MKKACQRVYGGVDRQTEQTDKQIERTRESAEERLREKTNQHKDKDKHQYGLLQTASAHTNTNQLANDATFNCD